MENGIENLQDLSRAHGSALEALKHAIRDLRASLSAPRFKVKAGGHIWLEMRRDMPYVMMTFDESGRRILVNRQYKPVGSNVPTGGKWAEYEDFPEAHLTLTNEQVKHAVSPGRDFGLFGDEDPPWGNRRHAKSYLDRLLVLREMAEAQQ